MSAAVLTPYVSAARRRRRGVAALFGLAATLATVAAGLLAELPSLALGALALATAAVTLAALEPWVRQADAARVAAHLSRAVPALEESGHLLAVPAGHLDGLARLQAARVAARLAGAAVPLPRPQLRPALLLVAAAALLLAGSIHFQRPTPSAGGGTDVAAVAAATPAAVIGAEVVVTPPAYARQPAAHQEGLDVEALAGARVAWRLSVEGPAEAAYLIFAGADTLRLAADGTDGFAGSRVVRASALYHAELRQAGAVVYRGAFHALTVADDLPPVVSLLAPTERVVLEPGQARRIAVRALADDDVGLAGARLRLTVARGSGEGVSFREVTLPLAVSRRDAHRAWTLTTTLDPTALALAPGDEVYGHVEAWDARAPAPQQGRSETFFVAVRDTSAWAVAEDVRLAVDPVPAFFRSQRQIILDTEKLVAERARLDAATFRDRANGIGLDQKALRLRYGQFLGEEYESEIAAGTSSGAEAAPGADRHDDAAHEAAGHDEEAAHAHETGPAPAAGASADPAAIIASFGHMHDTEEGATFYSDDIKRELKAALAEMWEAELRLRTARPEEALPFEYQALQLIKALQQKARVYVRRIGFEPPPLREERRLTGDLDDVRSRRAATAPAQPPVYPEVRAALDALAEAEGRALTTAEQEMLRAAAPTLAAAAAEAPGRYLEALEALRYLTTDARCAACRRRVLAGLWLLLPAPQPLPSRTVAPATDAATRYFEALRQGR